MDGPKVNAVAAAGFTREADAYERARPSYPDALVEVLVKEGGLRRGARVVDVAAGTGKLTRLLRPSGARVVAIEPLMAMAGSLVVAVPGVPLAAGLAEALPVASGSLDLVTVAQGFHWFDGPTAFGECRRVLRPGGHLALIWNERDESVPWVSEFTEILDRHGGGRPYVRDQDWVRLTAEAGFADVTSQRFDNPVVTDREGVVARAASTSYVAALPDDRRHVALAAVADLVADFSEPFVYPHITDLTLAVRA